MMNRDKLLRCRACGKQFVFTAAEQAFYAKKGFALWPRRCKDCRRTAQSRKPLHRAVCAACGRDTQVPFVPDESRMVYCRDCYAQIVAERREDQARRQRAE